MSSIGRRLIGVHCTFSCFKTRLSCCDDFFFTVGSRQGDSILGDYVLWSCYCRHDCDWTTAGHYKSILVIFIAGMIEGRGRRERGREGRGREGRALTREENGGKDESKRRMGRGIVSFSYHFLEKLEISHISLVFSYCFLIRIRCIVSVL